MELAPESLTTGRLRLAAAWSACVVTIATGCSSDLVGPANEIWFQTQPRNASADQVLAPVEVALRDVFGNPAAGRVTISIYDNRCDATLQGSVSRDAVGGVATFDDLVIDIPQSAYRLEARVERDTIVSVPFGITGPTGQVLQLTTTLCTKPNDQRDAESLAYLPGDDQFWMGDDDLPSIYHVERGSGSYVGRLDSTAFVAAFPGAGQCDDGDGNPATSCSYLSELEILTYDETNGFLYIINTVNSMLADPPVDKPAIFRLRKEACTGCLSFESWQELPPGNKYSAAVTINGDLYLAVDTAVYAYDYATNTLLDRDQSGNPVPPTYSCSCVIRGLAFDGSAFWVLTTNEIRKFAWSSMNNLFQEPLAGFGISLPKGIAVVAGTAYVVDGNEPHRIFALQE